MRVRLEVRDSIHRSDDTVPPVILEEIFTLSGSLSSNRAKGYDNIPAEVNKYASDMRMELLARLFTLMLRYRFLPERLQLQCVAPNTVLSPNNCCIEATGTNHTA